MASLRWLVMFLLYATALSKKHSVYRIYPQTSASLQFLGGLTKDVEIDFWKEPRAMGQEVHAMMTDAKASIVLDQLRSRNITFSVMIEDVEKVIKNQKLAQSKRKYTRSVNNIIEGKVHFNLAEYHSYDDIIEYFNVLAITYPHLISIQHIGETHEGRQIPLIKITNKNVAGRKRNMWIDGGIHAREWISPSTVLYFIHQLTEGYEQDPLIRKFVDDMEWNLVPLLNPDGYEYSRTSTAARWWRKNRSPAKCITQSQGLLSPPQSSCCQGVDLNRNFDWFFGEVSSSDPCADDYHGDSAFSEPETRAVRDFISNHNITSFITLHSYSQMLMYPFNHKKFEYVEDLRDHLITGLSAASALRSVYGTKYKVGTGADMLYPASGGSDDWAKGKGLVKYAFLFELRPDQKAFNGFLLSEDQILPTGRETWEAIKVIANRTLEVHLDEDQETPAS